MAVKQFYATGDFKYQTRMLRAGDPVELDAPNARLWAALGKISPTKPKAARAAEPIKAEAPAPAPAKPARKRKAAAKKK